ncbi:uncharacterized protein [Rutidosis leptorrhynchoides]|uniref:uncharacterized protein n=1 Tax=Rutidosis leptorrhynchoides TaxID=125765 RepID=UPI003A9A17F4
MESKQQQQQQKQQITSSPLPNQQSSSLLLLQDISNFKTPKPQRLSQTNPSFNFETPCSQFFSALQQTPKSSYSTVRRTPHRYSLAVRKLKAVELEQSKSSRKTQTDKDKSFKSLANSITVWLNFLLENPRSCGVEVSRFTGEESSDEASSSSSVLILGGKRDSVSHGTVEVDREWRGPKRTKDTLWVHKGEVENNKFSYSTYSSLKVSLGDVCSLDDLKERMAVYLSLTSCKEIFNVMTRVTKNIDEGRLKMKAHCPIVTDVGMKENALKILMSYNPVWLRIGLYIIFGGESLLPNSNTDTTCEQEYAFLKVVAEKLFFSHPGLAKAYIYNKLVDGLYRPGYYEKLGSVMLKKFLLLVLILDRAKSQSSLPIIYGIDGLDGGSPLLFTSRATIKSSCQVISDFLSPDVMHGVGNLLTQLTIIGYMVSYQQNPLVKYAFKVTDLFNDLRDGVVLCRVIQLLQHDPSILKKVAVPSDDQKKNLVNCEICLKYLKQIGVALCDEDGTEIIAEDIVNGDKELIICLLWNIFIHLQLPLLVNNKLISDEIAVIRGTDAQMLPGTTSGHLEMLLEWIKAICNKYDLKVENFVSLVDGKAMWCLLDYYFRKQHCHATFREDVKEINEVSIMSASDYVDAVHNFLLSQKLTSLLGNFPEVLQVSDILEYKGACSDRGVIILLVFLSSQLIVKKNLQQINFHKLFGHTQNSERKCSRRDRVAGDHDYDYVQQTSQKKQSEDSGRSFQAIMTWWKEMAQHNSSKADVSKADVKLVLQSLPAKHSSNKQRVSEENAAAAAAAAIMIQSNFRRFVEHRKYTRTKKAVSFLQIVIRVWLMVKKNISAIPNLNAIKIQEPVYDETNSSKRLFKYLVDRHVFVKLKRSVVIIQRAIRYWITTTQKHRNDAVIMIQKSVRSWILRKSFMNKKQAATKIQSHHRCRVLRKRFLDQKQAAATIMIQSCYHGWVMRRCFLRQKQAATNIQRHYRGHISRKSSSYLAAQKQAAAAATIIQSYHTAFVVRKNFLNQKKAATTIQCHYRRWLLARNSLMKLKQAAALKLQKFYRKYKHHKLEIKSAVTIQCAYRRYLCFKAFNCYMDAAIVIQRFVRRGCLDKQKQLLFGVPRHQEEGARSERISLDADAAETRTKSATVIQATVRGWIARRRTAQTRHRIAVIQSYWKGYIERKQHSSREKVSDIRLRVQKAAANVEDGMRIINRLIAALSELKNTISVTEILHTCATLEMATRHSEKCCEELVGAGAINTLLGLVSSISRSIADQEVLRLILSTLRNITCHPHLTQALIHTHESCRIILWEFIRNKGDVCFIAADILRNICSIKEGVNKLHDLPGLVKRLHNLVEHLKKKAGNKRNPQAQSMKAHTDRRMKEAIQILKLITNSQSSGN